MKRLRIPSTIAMIIVISAVAVLSWGCKKQPKCGCDGDALDTLRLIHVNISYDVDNKTARFSVLGDPYAVYYFCNPSEWMSQLSKFEQGEEILISGPYFYECNYLMNSSNSPYYYGMRIYQINVTAAAEDEFGK